MKKNNKKEVKEKAPEKVQELSSTDIPPSLKQEPENLIKEAEELKQSETPDNVVPLKRPRGRPPGSKNKPRDGKVDEIPGFPVEALELLHQNIWNFICQQLQSEYRLSKESAHEMAVWANLCIKQYVSPMLAEYYVLAGYTFTQVTALGVAISMRKPANKQIAEKTK